MMEVLPTETKLPPLKKKVVPSVDEQHMHEILASIYLGDIESSQDGVTLKNSGISYMVDLANTVELDQTQRGKKHFEVNLNDESCDWSESCSCIKSKLFINVDDTEDGDIGEHFDIINEYVTRALESNDKILVHCVRGKSRSAAAVVQYLMQMKEYTLRAAMRTVYQGRPGVAINPGFKNQLQKLEARLRPGEPPSVILKVASKKPSLSRLSSSSTKSFSSNSSVGSTTVPTNDNDDDIPSTKSPITSVRKLPPYSPDEEIVGGVAAILSKEGSSTSIDGGGGGEINEDDVAPSYCTLTMSDSMTDIKAAAKKHGVNDRGTKKQLISRLIAKLGPNPNETPAPLPNRKPDNPGLVIDLKNASEFPEERVSTNNSTPTISLTATESEQSISSNMKQTAPSPSTSTPTESTSSSDQQDNNNNKMPPITVSPNSKKKNEQHQTSNTDSNKMPPISLSPNSITKNEQKKKEEDNNQSSSPSSGGLIPIVVTINQPSSDKVVVTNVEVVENAEMDGNEKAASQADEDSESLPS